MSFGLLDRATQTVPASNRACTRNQGCGIYSSRMALGRTRDEFEDRIDAAMDRCANGDDAAFGEVYELMGPKLIMFFLRQGATRELAEDLLQDVAVRLYRARGNFQRGASAMAWAYGVSRNAYIDHLRAAKTRRVVVSDDDALGRVASDESTSAEAMVSAGQQAAHLAAALEELPHAQRQAYELRHVHGLDVSEAAAEAGVTENAFKIRVHRAKEALRRALNLLISDEE